MKVDELVGSLQTFELGVSERSEKKNKSITFVSNVDDEEEQSDMETDESISEAIVLLGRQFNKILMKVDRRPVTNVKNISLDISKNTNAQRKPRTDEKTNQVKGVQCHECEDDSEGEVESEAVKNITALTGRYMYDTDSCDEEVSYEELAASYKELCI
ncbi:gag-pol polyprotein, partial [Trifolium medium]|nr:gag-pol polyprotein [Trifolium medium]